MSKRSDAAEEVVGAVIDAIIDEAVDLAHHGKLGTPLTRIPLTPRLGEALVAHHQEVVKTK